MNNDKTSLVANQLAPAQMEQHYLSPFSVIRNVAELEMAAKVFASSGFAPQNFQGNVPNCMIALDMANQLQMNVLTLMQQLYIINGRPAISTALANSLFNMQLGRAYTPIQIVRGVDGTIKYGNEQIPNHWAIAVTRDRVTGEKFESPKVSVQTAFKNGWYTKTGSKWQTLPELMCGYRATAFLVRTHFPQVLLGMYFQDEVEDFTEKNVEVSLQTNMNNAVNNAVPLTVETSEVHEEDELFEGIEKAETPEELREIGKKISGYDLSADIKNQLRRAYSEKNKELGARQKVTEVVEEEKKPAEEEKPKRTRRPRKTEDKEESSNQTIAETIISMIQAANTPEELDSISKEVRRQEESGVIDQTLSDQLNTCIETRYLDLSEKEEEDAPTEQQEEYARQILAAIKSQKSPEDVDRQLDNARQWMEGGYLTKGQYERLVEEAETLKKVLKF